MKVALAAMVLSLFALIPAAWADSADDRYVGIFNVIQQADALSQSGQSAAALAKYAEAQTALKRFQGIYPEWNVKVVSFRLSYLAGKIADLTPKAAPVVVPTASPANTAIAVQAPVPILPPAVVVPPPPDPNEVRIKALEEQVRRLEADNGMLQANRILLEAKLREALTVQPVAADLREYNRAQEQIRELQKQNDLLQVSLVQARTNRVPVDTTELDDTRKSLDDATRRVTALTAANAALLAERNDLKARVPAPAAAGASTAALQQENEVLRKQVAELKSSAAKSAPGGDVNRKLLETEAQLALLLSDREMLRLEKIALEDRVKRLSANPSAAAVVPDAQSAEKIRQLETQRDDLQKRLDVALKEGAAGKKDQEAVVRADEMSRELAALRSRIDVLEARRVPYTEEELALLSKPGGPVMVASIHSGGARPASQLPGNGAALLAEARKHYTAHELDQAEAKYRELLKLDEQNASILTDLASVQVDLNHLADAEQNAKAALALNSNSDYSLFVLGRVKFQQDKYDEALEAFSQAAQINAKDPDIQNYLGITLSEKGLRGPAETALRRAVELDPGNASAHANLAFIYVTRKPPLIDLARWHYEKALAVGHPHNPAIEKLLDPDKSTAVAR